jgi:RNA recognition motif-containing protein
MRVKLFVGNLPWSVGDTDLEDLFSPHGEVQSARVITDRDTGRSRGFGFVEMDAKDVAAVISAVNGREIDGRPLRVNEAEDKGGFGGPRRDNRDRGPRNRY